MTHVTRALQSHDLSGEEINFGSQTYFWPHKDMEGLTGSWISSMPGPPPRQHEHETRYTSFKHPFILTRWIWKDDYDGPIFGDLVGLKHPDTCLTGEEKPTKKSHPGILSRSGIETGPGMTGAHATVCSTNCYVKCQNFMILILHILDLENRKHTKFQFNWSVSFRYSQLPLRGL